MTETEKTSSTGWERLSKLSYGLAIVVGFVVIVFFSILYVTDDIDLIQKREAHGYSTVEHTDCAEIADETAPIGIRKQYTFRLDQTLENDTYLAFYTVHQYVKVWLGDQQVYSLNPTGEHRLSKTVGGNWVMIPLYPEDVGTEICVEITPVYESFRNRQVDFLIGSQLAIYSDRLAQDLPQLILGILAVFVGLIFLSMAVSNLFRWPHGSELASLGMFSLMMGLWRLTDTRFTPLILPEHPVFLFYLSVAMLMVGVLPIIKAVKKRFDKMSCRVFDIYCVLAEVICILQFTLQMFRVMDVRDNLVVTHAMILLGMLIIVGNVIYDWRKYPQKHEKYIQSGIPIVCFIGVLADIIAFYFRGTSSGLLFSLLSLLIYIVFSGVSILFRYSKQEKQLAEIDRKLAEKERQLTENRIATMMSQIQPHFIYNTLGTIGQFCLEDPQKAQDLVQKFSMYLRGNFTELGESAPIRISKEMEHVRYYADIEQIRFPDMQVIYDLRAEEFLIPALTVQPLVENAIKHGLMGLESGGTVTVSTYETKKAYFVRVEDDGIGFDDSVYSDGKKHVGIQNIRTRLATMCGGTLTINSIRGKGTTAEIMIPKEGE